MGQRKLNFVLCDDLEGRDGGMEGRDGRKV